MNIKMYFSITMRAAALSLVAAALTSLTACRQDEEPARPDDTPRTYTLDIPATMGDDATRAVTFNGNACAATFTALEHVYVYNTNTDEVMTGFLSPKDITADGTGCHLTGTLSGGTISADDELMLLYNLNRVSTNKIGDNHKWGSYFDYNNQDGTAGGVVDGATAMVSVESYTTDPDAELTTTAAVFQSAQSMFRFQFEDEDGEPISVKSLIIHSGNNALVEKYRPLLSDYHTYDITVSRGSATTDPIYCALCFDENNSNGDKLAFMVEDGAGKSHFAWKDAPSGGFRNGKYYYNSSPICLPENAPTITWTNPSYPVFPDDDNCFIIDQNYYDITLSGTSNDFWFNMSQTGTLLFHNLTATTSSDYPFINVGDNNNLTLEISGDNTIITEYTYALMGIGELKLYGEGTLTIACESDGYYGIDSSNYNGDVDAIAAEGYTVTRSDRFNYNRKYAWTYTVTPNQ